MTDDKDIRQQGTDFFENSVTISFFCLQDWGGTRVILAGRPTTSCRASRNILRE
jgi:hypothetical protein